MRRVAIASAWLVGSIVPVVFAAAFIFGCCVLPFHRTLHRLMPLCQMAMGVLHQSNVDDDHHPAPQPSQKQGTNGPSLVTILATRQATANPTAFAVAAVQQSRMEYRSFISLGALRCDEDVGLQRLLIETFRI